MSQFWGYKIYLSRTSPFGRKKSAVLGKSQNCGKMSRITTKTINFHQVRMSDQRAALRSAELHKNRVFELCRAFDLRIDKTDLNLELILIHQSDKANLEESQLTRTEK